LYRCFSTINSSNIVIKAIETLNTSIYKTGTYKAPSSSGTVTNGEDHDAVRQVAKAAEHILFTNDTNEEIVISIATKDYGPGWTMSISTAYFENKEGVYEELPSGILKVLHPGKKIKVKVVGYYGEAINPGETRYISGGGGTCSYTLYKTTWENP